MADSKRPVEKLTDEQRTLLMLAVDAEFRDKMTIKSAMREVLDSEGLIVSDEFLKKLEDLDIGKIGESPVNDLDQVLSLSDWTQSVSLW